jgi:KUP system potassium uptake protein
LTPDQRHPSADRRSAGARPVAATAGGLGLSVTALGVVFGDIGTSPLYAIQAVFSIGGGVVRVTPEDVRGVISLVLWALTLSVSIKYVTVVMRADNDGEGGILALAALVQRTFAKRGAASGLLVGLGILGASLFYGDSVITPAISVLSAVEGLKVIAPSLRHVVVPASVAILAGLFALQRRGTQAVGALFGPVMVAWFMAIGLAGVRGIALDPSILTALDPRHAMQFVIRDPGVAFVALGAVVLAVTGAEALYADMGQVGPGPIRQGWFVVVFPALALNYAGQGALLLHDPHAAATPFFLLLPVWSRIPMLVLATAATVIASQAVISGAFSMSRQAMQLGLLPRLTVRQTSERQIGQVYVPLVNWALFAIVTLVVIGFGSSGRLASAYGLAVSGTFLVTTILFLAYARARRRWQRWKVAAGAVAFGGVELVYLAANIGKVVHGGWLPLLIAGAVFVVFTTWQRGSGIVTANRIAAEGSLPDFIAGLDERRGATVVRVPGTAVYPSPSTATAPLAMRAAVERTHALHRTVIVVTAKSMRVPHVAPAERVTVEDLGDVADGIVHVTARFGFKDAQDLPRALRQVVLNGVEKGVDLDDASYILSQISIVIGDAPPMPAWQKRLFAAMARNAASPADYFGLPNDRTVIVSSRVSL